MVNCPDCADCRKTCPELEAANVALGDAKKRITELESHAADHSQRWASLNSENQSLKIWQKRVIFATTGEHTP